jgi:ferric-dicitrate binding protein FerR (iron transport regulator)
VNPRPDARLDELFVRYWANDLTAAEAEELELRLAADPTARAWFEHFAQQAVVAAELPANLPAEPRRPAAPVGRRWSRRRVLRFVGGGLAAGVGAVALGRWFWPNSPTAAPVRIVATTGNVTVLAADGQKVAGRGLVPPGGSVVTNGPGSSAVLSYADGTTITLTGDSSLAVAATGRRLILGQGVATADIRPRPDGGEALTMVTAQVTLPELSGVMVTLGRVARATEVEVHRGSVTASAPSGEQLGVVEQGEVLTVRADGGHRKQPIPPTPEEFAWDLMRPLAEGWEVGHLDETEEGPVVVPEYWPDPYYNGTRMYQIRSNQPWLRGFVRFQPDSQVRVRYRADRAGSGQVCFCTRTTDSRAPETGMLEWNGPFVACAPGEWQELVIRAADMLGPPNKHAPKFAAPWVAFLVIFNTYTADLGLRVAEFRVTRPGGGG